MTSGSTSLRPLWRLASALTSPADPDRYLELLGPTRLRNEVRATVTSIEHQTPRTVTLTLSPSRSWAGHRAGQHVRLGIDVGGAIRSRYYTLAHSQHAADRLLELTVSHQAGGLVSTELVRSIRTGQVVRLSQAEGEFVLPWPRPPRLVLITGGCGITPAMSMLRTLADEKHTGDVLLLHYTPSAIDLPYRDGLARLQAQLPGARAVVVHTRPPYAPVVDGHLLKGHFSVDHLEPFAPWFADAPAYVCGPPSLVADVVRCYEAEDAGEQLRVESFSLPGELTGAARTAGSSGTPATITFSRSGISVPGTGATILQQAEAAGLHPEHGCRIGACHECLATKRSGAVRNLLTGQVHDQPGEQVQLCVCVPDGNVDLAL